MATLASIPEASTSLSGGRAVRPPRQHRRTASFERIRPRSRVVVLSRRPSRARHLAQPPPPRPPTHDTRRHADAAGGSVPGASPGLRQHHGHLRIPHKPSASLGESGSRMCDTDHVLETSLSDVDLDSFPLPPAHGMPQARRIDHVSLATRTENTNMSSSAKHPATITHTQPRNARSKCTSGPHLGLASVAAAGVARSSKHSSVDSTLVEAISRAVVQQLRLFSAIKQGKQAFTRSEGANASSPFAPDSQSRTSTQRDRLDRFTKDLHTYVEDMSVKGKRVQSTPSATAKSGDTLHTVSALMPFRPEFRAAGLAVTSKDQARPRAKAEQRWLPNQHAHAAERRRPEPSQYDGPPGRESSSSANTEIAFTRPQDMDEWTYALIDEAPARKQRLHRHGTKQKKAKSHCLPCFPGSSDLTPDTDWAHFRPPPVSSVPKPRPLAGPVSRMPATKAPHPPRSLQRAKDVSNPLDPMKRPRERANGRVAEKQSSQDFQRKRPEAAPGWRVPSSVRRDDAEGSGRGGFSHGKSTPKVGDDARPDPRPLRSQSDRARLDRDAKQFERELLSPRPYQSLPGHDMPVAMGRSQPSRAPGKPRSGEADLNVESDGQCYPMSSLEEELERTARLVAATKAPTGSKVSTRRTRRQPSPPSLYDPHHVGFCCRASRGLPSRAIAPPNIPKRTSSMRGSWSSLE
ncbi:hypothetical protein JDV02_001682 [Purpureocillium takamizusanense]|uniref:Uncharacterized protein n=1 Tax=Purpureocillium takamizusanense TaxID=2060973 RepID=A0A9Q8Q9E9_9HYPO|nr:uncharacterized protein JDV02_001682 [Purpureocillium takamizusanense]UNI15116.1 hypothetical protein JDV02_001682 [Purpureocillium takamizusanense]